MKMLIAIKKSTGEQKIVDLSKRRIVLKVSSQNHSDEYVDICILFSRLLEKYKDEPLVKYKLNEYDKKRIENDPSYIENIPRYIVKGFDSAIGSEFESKAREEFYERLKDFDTEVIDFINRTNTVYKVKVKEVWYNERWNYNQYRKII